ncbi:basic proline-rich protein precursor [Micromonospora sp. B006]|nr:basic proline-rich protein precursor [Micromonospora sp. B006]
MQAQRELHLQRPLRPLPVRAEQLPDPFQPLGDSVDVHVQLLGGPGQAAAHPEVRLQRLHKRGAPPRVVVHHRTHCRGEEPGHVPVPGVADRAQQQPDEAQLGGARPLPGPAQRAERGQAALRLGERDGQRRRPGRRAARPGGHRPAGQPRQVPGHRPGRAARVLAGQHQHHPPVARRRQAAAGRGVRGGPGQHALPGRAGLGERVVADRHQHVRRVQVHPDAAGPRPQRVGVAQRPGDQVVQQLAADPPLRLGHRAAEQQQQRGHQRGALQDALVGVDQLVVRAQHQRAQVLRAGHHRGVPERTPAHAASLGTRRGDRLHDVRPVRLLDLADPGQPPALGVQRQQRPAEHLGDRRGHVLHPAAAHHQRGHPVVRGGGALHRAAVRPDRAVRRRQLRQRRPRLGEQSRGVDRHRRVRRERHQQRHLLPGERPGRAVRRVQHADHAGAQPQRHAQDGHQALLAHPAVDLPGVPEPLVLLVVRGDVRRAGLRDQAAQSVAQLQPQPLEPGRDRAVGHPHVGVAALLVVERHVRHVGAEQDPRPVHDRAQHVVQVAQPGQVARGVVQAGQLGLPAAPAGQQRPHPQRHHLRLLQLGQPLGGQPGGARGDERALELDRGCLARQQLQELDRRRHDRHCAGRH